MIFYKFDITCVYPFMFESKVGEIAAKGARNVGFRYVTEELLDALPSTAEKLRKSLLRELYNKP